MADVVHTHHDYGPDSSGPSAAIIALTIVLIAFLLLGAWWLFWSDSSPIQNNTIITPNTGGSQQAPQQPEGDTNIVIPNQDQNQDTSPTP